MRAAWWRFAVVAGVLGAAASGNAQGSHAIAAYRDRVPVRIVQVPVEPGVSLEVLDWGGRGRPVVLLAGLGDTAHVFDSFAPLLTSRYHVYGITRRGFGDSSHPAAGYTAARLGEDVVAVLDALKLEHPVLAGHSIAGEELSWIANHAPAKAAGLVYLDAGYAYAFYSPAVPDFPKDVPKLQAKLGAVLGASGSAKTALIDELLQTELPRMEQELREQKESIELAPKSGFAPSAADKASVAAFERWLTPAGGCADACG